MEETVRIIGGKRALDAYYEAYRRAYEEWRRGVYWYRDGRRRRFWGVRVGKNGALIELRIYSTDLRRERGHSTRTRRGNPIGYVRWSQTSFLQEFGIPLERWQEAITPEWLAQHGIIDPESAQPPVDEIAHLRIRYEVVGEDLRLTRAEFRRIYGIQAFREAMRTVRAQLVLEVPVEPADLLVEYEPEMVGAAV